MTKEVMKRDESKKNKIEEKKVVTAFNIKAILQWAINAKPIPLKKKKTRLDVEFFKEEDMAEIPRMNKLLKEIFETEHATTIEEVTPNPRYMRV